jgi:hypothetical protein
MPIDEQWINTYWSRFVGVYWQSCGLTVIPTISWGDERSFGFCFAGIEEGAVVAVSTIGTRHARTQFLGGFKEFCVQNKPECVICYCSPYPEMHNYAKILALEHEGNRVRRLMRQRPVRGQLALQIENGNFLYDI